MMNSMPFHSLAMTGALTWNQIDGGNGELSLSQRHWKDD